MVGGLDYAKSQFNRVAQARRQPGSTFKPFVYAAAFDRGFTPANLLDDFPISYSIPQNGRTVDWRPENFDHQFRGQVTLRHALEESINVPTVRLLEAVGMDPVIALAHRMGIKSELRREYGLALGVSEVTLLELTGAYAVLGNQGLRVPPTGIRRVVGPSGEVLEAAAAGAGPRPAGGGGVRHDQRPAGGGGAGDGQAGARAGVERGGEDGHQPGRGGHVVRGVHAPARRRSLGRLRSAAIGGVARDRRPIGGAGVGGLHAAGLAHGAQRDHAHSGGYPSGARELPDRPSDQRRRSRRDHGILHPGRRGAGGWACAGRDVSVSCHRADSHAARTIPPISCPASQGRQRPIGRGVRGSACDGVKRELLPSHGDGVQPGMVFHPSLVRGIP